ncbi:MAG: phosphate ABC transporter permease subunit PstC [Planctomycetes bacterium]|nr:phosphate ABC transporter permease subunit PstC [Planctomycetota bacterium]
MNSNFNTEIALDARGAAHAESLLALSNLGTRKRIFEKTVVYILFTCALLSVLTSIAFIYILVSESVEFFEQISVFEFLTGTKWFPNIIPYEWGALPIVLGTLMIAVGSALFAVPLGLFVGIYLSEYASKRTRSLIKPVLEVLAGIPTVVYGYFALILVTPFLQGFLGSFGIEVGIFNALSGSIVVGIMVLPMVASLCDDAMKSVPISLRQAGYAVGATKFEVSLRVVTPAALSGVIAAFILAISRAIGETMIVSIAAGGAPVWGVDYTEGIQTMTAFIVQVSTGDSEAGSVQSGSIFAVGLLLFLITLAMNIIAHKVLRKFKESYE